MSSSDAGATPVSPVAGATRACAWCGVSLKYSRQLYCGKRCRQTAWRCRELGVSPAGATPKTLRYADPPYPGLARKYYSNEPTYAGEVDHPALIASLTASSDAWALSTSARSLRVLLPLCPPSVRVCVWVKANTGTRRSLGIHNAWEAVIVQPARRPRPAVPDYLYAKPARGGDSSLPGRKPLAFCVWLFRLLGAERGDTLIDLYPGSGVVSRAWAQFNREEK